MNKFNRRGQSSLAEYAVVIAVVTAAIIGLQIFKQRGIQSVIKESFDKLGNQTDADLKDDRIGIPVAKGGEHAVSMRYVTSKDETIETTRISGDDERPQWRQDVTYGENDYSGAEEYSMEVYGGYAQELTNE